MFTLGLYRNPAPIFQLFYRTLDDLSNLLLIWKYATFDLLGIARSNGKYEEMLTSLRKEFDPLSMTMFVESFMDFAKAFATRFRFLNKNSDKCPLCCEQAGKGSSSNSNSDIQFNFPPGGEVCLHERFFYWADFLDEMLFSGGLIKAGFPPPGPKFKRVAAMQEKYAIPFEGLVPTNLGGLQLPRICYSYNAIDSAGAVSRLFMPAELLLRLLKSLKRTRQAHLKRYMALMNPPKGTKLMKKLTQEKVQKKEKEVFKLLRLANMTLEVIAGNLGYCAYCLRHSSARKVGGMRKHHFSKCKKCEVVYFCGSKCYRVAFKYHKFTCGKTSMQQTF